MSACQNCKKTPPEVNLKRCAKCSSAWYCSRDCQKADWKSHRKACGKADRPAAGETNDRPAPSASGPGSAGSAVLSPPRGVDGPVSNPFTRLEHGTWLHDRPEKDVYRLLIDSFRMRTEDIHNFRGDAMAGTLYAGEGDSTSGFLQYLAQIEREHRRLLPSWWSAEHKAKCLEFGTTDEWANLGYAIEKSDVIEHYGEQHFPMQLRMFAEGVYGSGPDGGSGAAMRRMMMMSEGGELERA